VNPSQSIFFLYKKVKMIPFLKKKKKGKWSMGFNPILTEFAPG